MFIVVWEYQVDEAHREAFEREYGPEGTWAQFLRRGPGFIRTDLMHDANRPERYLTFDFWSSRQSCDEFRAANESQYQSIDQRMSPLTLSEKELGGFEMSVPGQPE